MLNTATWLLAAVALGGVALSGFYLADRPIRGLARAASIAHGIAGAAGVALALWAITSLADAQGFGRLATATLLLTLAAGLAIAALCRRRPPGALVAVHALLGVTALVLLAAFAATP